MRSLRKFLFGIVMVTPIFLTAQSYSGENGATLSADEQGIKWTKGLNWKQVLKKASKEKKFIFIDCFTTWCGPCKQMEMETFPNKEVGNFFNTNFLSVRLQMDKTANDDKDVKNWYRTADNISRDFGIPSYPTFLFFSPDGKLVYREGGLKYPNELMDIGKKAVESSEAFPYSSYYSLLAKYLQGKKDYSTMAGLADTAKMLLQDDIAESVSQEYRKYLLSRSEAEWYTPQNLSFMASFVKGSADPFFKSFYLHSGLVDSIVGKKGLSRVVVDNIIQVENIEPITKPIKGMRYSGDTAKALAEPDWSAIEREVEKRYSKTVAERNLLYSRTVWYYDHNQWDLCAKYFTSLIKKYPAQEYAKGNYEAFLNSTCWNAVFKRSSDKERIDAAIACMENMIKRINATDNRGASPAILDTYANLLYKAGRTEEAIRQEEEAFKKDTIFLNTLNRMKERKPTWPHYVSNAFWDNGLVD